MMSEKEIDAVVERLFSALLKNVDRGSVAVLNNPDKHPTLVGIPLEVIHRDGSKIVLTSGNARIPNADRVVAEIKDVDFFYDHDLIENVFKESIGVFLDPYLVSRYAGLDDPDFERDFYEDF